VDGLKRIIQVQFDSGHRVNYYSWSIFVPDTFAATNLFLSLTKSVDINWPNNQKLDVALWCKVWLCKDSGTIVWRFDSGVFVERFSRHIRNSYDFEGIAI